MFSINVAFWTQVWERELCALIEPFDLGQPRLTKPIVCAEFPPQTGFGFKFHWHSAVGFSLRVGFCSLEFMIHRWSLWTAASERDLERYDQYFDLRLTCVCCGLGTRERNLQFFLFLDLSTVAAFRSTCFALTLATADFLEDIQILALEHYVLSRRITNGGERQ